MAVGELRSGFVGVVFEIWWTVHRERCEAAAAEFGDSHTVGTAHGLETDKEDISVSFQTHATTVE